LIPPETTDAFAPKVLRSGMGAHFKLPIWEMSWEEIANLLGASHLKVSDESNPTGAAHSGLQVLIADMNGISCWQTDLTKPTVLIIGSEAEGASESARKLANGKISIPMSGDIESLNAGVAGSVLMFEVLRQRRKI
jgi:TrmH family RNA methyltransferase